MTQRATIEVPTGGAPAGGAPAGGAGAEKLILGKFKDHAALEAAYTELEKKQGGAKPEGEVTIPAVTGTAGLDMKALSQEYVQNGGKLTDATIEALAKRGIPRDVIDTYITSSQSQAGQITNELNEIAGGPEAMKGLLSWASANMTPQEIAAYNEAVSNPSLAKLALQGLMAQYRGVTGEDPALLTSESTPNVSGTQGYESNAQVIAAMSDPKYENDPAYRKQVERRMAVSDSRTIGVSVRS